ncbi:MAG: substrate-binding domain-containing protein [Phycisphaerales bacterium]|nr:substrate-binding domain-containing protein [Phycisphaerales bacterium]
MEMGTKPVRMRRILVAIDATAAYQRQMLRGIIAYARAIQPAWEFLFNHRPEPLDFKLKIHKEIDGVLLHEVSAPTIAPRSVRLLKRHSDTVVLIEQRSDAFPTVLSDSHRIGCMAYDYYKTKGFHNYAYFERTGLWVFDERRQAFEEAVERDGRQLFRPPADLMDFSRPPAAIEKELGQWLMTIPKPMALFAGAIIPARQAATACRSVGIAVPDEVAILGVGHDEIDGEMATPPLSAIDHGMDRAGYEAAALLDRMMQGQAPPSQPIRVPPVQVVERQSSDVLAVEDDEVRTAVRWIRDHALHAEGIGQMLRQLPFGRRRLEIAFKRHLGRTIHQEILRVRLERVKYLLRHSQMPLPDIAAHCGFNYASGLTAVFTQTFGTTPTAYRRESRSAGMNPSTRNLPAGME